jgi:hypothetical protein
MGVDCMKEFSTTLFLGAIALNFISFFYKVGENFDYKNSFIGGSNE